MTPQQFVGLGLRLFAIWLLIAAVQNVAYIPAVLDGVGAGDNRVKSYAVVIAYVAAAVLLWLFPMWIAHKLLPRTRFENHLQIHAAEAARVGCALIGLWLFAQGLLSNLWFVLWALLFSGQQSVFVTLGKDAQLDLLIAIATMVIGVVLMLRAGTFAAVIVPDRATQHAGG